MTGEQAFICHNGDHWLAIRKVNGVWYNLNSTNVIPPGPQTITDFMLDAILAQVKENGFEIFIVRPAEGKELPGPDQTKPPLRSC